MSEEKEETFEPIDEDDVGYFIEYDKFIKALLDSRFSCTRWPFEDRGISVENGGVFLNEYYFQVLSHGNLHLNIPHYGYGYEAMENNQEDQLEELKEIMEEIGNDLPSSHSELMKRIPREMKIGSCPSVGEGEAIVVGAMLTSEVWSKIQQSEQMKKDLGYLTNLYSVLFGQILGWNDRESTNKDQLIEIYENCSEHLNSLLHELLKSASKKDSAEGQDEGIDNSSD